MRAPFLALLILAAPAAAQEPWALPNPLQGGNVAATCQTWEATRAAGDPRAMQLVAGTWDGQGTVPGVPGLYPDTPTQMRSVDAADGTFQARQHACFQMQSVAGMAPMAPSCATSMIHGEWTAHFGAQGEVVVATLSSGSGFSGQALPLSCAAGAVRFQDQSTMIDMGGNVSRRAG